MWGVRAPKALQEYVEAETKKWNLEKAGYLVEMMEREMDLRLELGDDLYVLEMLAKTDGISVGTKLARMVRPLLKRR